MSTFEEDIKKRLADLNAVRTDDHFIYTSGRHGHTYVDKNRIFLDPLLVDQICECMADKCEEMKVDVVAGPEKGGIVLANLVAVHLPRSGGNFGSPDCIFLEKEDPEPTIRDRIKKLLEGLNRHPYLLNPLKETLTNDLANFNDENDPKGEESFALKRGYDKIVKGKKVLITEDVMTTGGSVAKSITAIRAAGGEVIGVVAICNRGGVTAQQLGVPYVGAFMNIDLPSWPEVECPMCKAGKPVNEEVGHGRDYMNTKRAATKA